LRFGLFTTRITAGSGWLARINATGNCAASVTLHNLLPYLAYFFITAPLIFVSLPFALWKEYRERKLSPLLLLAEIGLLADLLLYLNYSTAVNWRYFLTGCRRLRRCRQTFCCEFSRAASKARGLLCNLRDRVTDPCGNVWPVN